MENDSVDINELADCLAFAWVVYLHTGNVCPKILLPVFPDVNSNEVLMGLLTVALHTFYKNYVLGTISWDDSYSTKINKAKKYFVKLLKSGKLDFERVICDE